MTNTETEYTDCPICGHTEEKPLLQKDGWHVVRCVSCTLARINPRRKNSWKVYENDDYFQDENYYYDYVGNKEAYQKGFRSKLKLIAQHSPHRGKLLDVGAAYGFFMEEALKFGFEAFGVELSRAAAEHAAHYGEVFRKPLSEVETEHRFSAITFIDSLEHFEDPTGGLRKAWTLLEEQGIVAVMVPNIDSIFARVTGTKWNLLLPEEHLYYFNPKSIRLMFEKTGFELVHLGSGGYGRSAAEILRVLMRGKRLPLDHVEKLLRKITFEINVGDIFAIGRKTSEAHID